MSATAPAAPPAPAAPTAPRALLDVLGASKTFHARSVNEVRALQGITLQLGPGEFTTIIGGNGAGKSTLLNVLAGVFPPDSGRIVLAGRDITRRSEHSRAAMIGRVFQNPFAGTAPNLTVAQNLAMALRRGQARGLGLGVTDARRGVFRDQLATLGLRLEDRLDSRVGLLSGGQRQALTLLMATLVKPALLLLDEHTAALDPATANTVIDLTPPGSTPRRGRSGWPAAPWRTPSPTRASACSSGARSARTRRSASRSPTWPRRSPPRVR